MTRSVLRVRRDERGIALIMTAIFMSVLFIASSFAIDLGGRAQQKRDAHRIADLAALDGVRGSLTSADAKTGAGSVPSVISQVITSADNNGFHYGTGGHVLTVTRGTWSTTLFKFLPESAGYWKINADKSSTYVSVPGTPTGSAPYNAVQVTASNPYHDLFQAANPTATLTATSTAIYATLPNTTTPLGQFQIGSTLVTVSTAQSQILNSLLSPFGITSNLDAVGYQGLVNNSTTLGVLATQLGLTGLSPDQVLASNVKVSDLVAAEINLLGVGSLGSCSSASASCSSAELTVLKALLVAASYNSSHQINLGNALGIQTGDGAGFGTTVNLFNALVGAIQLADGSAAISIPSLTVSVAGATVSASVSAITPAKRSKYGTAPQSATDTQVTTTLNVSFSLGVSYLLIPYVLNVSLPVSVTVGSNTGTMTAVNCPAAPGTTPTGMTINPVTFQTATFGVNGSVTVLGLGLATVTGSQDVESDPVANTNLAYNTNFTPGGGTVVTVGSPKGAPTNWTGRLTVGGPLVLVNTIVNLALGSITSTLGTVLSSVSTTVLSPLLTALGVHIGSADLLGLQATCPAPSLVG